MTTPLQIFQNDHFLQTFINRINKVKRVYQIIFFYIGYIGVWIVSLLLTPILYTVVLLALISMKRGLKNDLKKLVVKIDETNYEDFKIKYDKTTNLIDTFHQLNLKSTKIPFLLKPIVNQIISINDIFIGFQQKLSVVETYINKAIADKAVVFDEIKDFHYTYKISMKSLEEDWNKSEDDHWDIY